jgi:hypothetical protein
MDDFFSDNNGLKKSRESCKYNLMIREGKKHKKQASKQTEQVFILCT